MNVIFDIGKVLVDFDFEGYVRSWFPGEAGEAVIRAMWESGEWEHLDKADLPDEEILKRFISHSPEHEKEIRLTFARLGEIPQLKPFAIPMIEELKRRGHKVYYLSNYFEYLMHTAPWALEFIPHMDGGVFSCHHHRIKPDREIYRILCEKYSLRPEECIFFDDSEKNIEAAGKFGMTAVLYKGQSFEELEKEAPKLCSEKLSGR